MSAQAASKSKEKDRAGVAPSIVWFEIPADDLEPANRFYGTLFDWRIEPFSRRKDYWHIDTGGGEDTPDGGLMAHCHPQQAIIVYVNVKSVTDSMAKVENLGGKICTPKITVPDRGYFVIKTIPSLSGGRTKTQNRFPEKLRVSTLQNSTSVKTITIGQASTPSQLAGIQKSAERKKLSRRRLFVRRRGEQKETYGIENKPWRSQHSKPRARGNARYYTTSGLRGRGAGYRVLQEGVRCG
jgi:predicted enzyme related to lactoylglutathione lyase